MGSVSGSGNCAEGSLNACLSSGRRREADIRALEHKMQCGECAATKEVVTKIEMSFCLHFRWTEGTCITHRSACLGPLLPKLYAIRVRLESRSCDGQGKHGVR